MSRTYSDNFLSEIEASTSTRTGVMLARACIKANIPALYIAQAMNVSRMTIYSWFRGKPLRDKNEEAVKLLINIINNDIITGLLPATTLAKAKEYVSTIVEKPITD